MLNLSITRQVPSFNGRKMVFKVAAISDNTNSFGLHQHVLIAQDGTAYTACANSLNKKTVGDEIECNVRKFHEHSFEIPQQIKDAPPEVVKEVWNDE